MIRSLFGLLAATVIVSATGAQGCAASGVGDPCIPEQEFATNFLGFDPQEVNVESKSFQCLTRLCLVNHFRGRVSCPYGQDKTQTMLPGTDGASSGPFPPTDGQMNPVGPCLTPDGSQPIDGKDMNGTLTDPVDVAQVHPQCVDRESANTVYCSCRCANANGKTDDGAVYCTCPDGYDCSQLINPIASIDPDLTGAYCIKKGTEFQSFSACQLPCDPTIPGQNCAPPSIR
jgi:hypothetical protein